jgi:tetratricopeptide (TPR) repeat protein
MTARLLPLLCVLLPLAAPAREPKPRTYDIIIVGGGKTEAEAQAALDRLKEKVLWVRVARGGYLGVHKSEDFPGLNKGLHIAVLGLCAGGKGTDNKALLNAVKALAPGTYSKSIKGQYGDPCPPLAAFTPPDAEEKPLLERIAKEPGSADAYVAYGAHLKDAGRLEEARVIVDHALELNPDHEEAKGLAQTLMVLLTD